MDATNSCRTKTRQPTTACELAAATRAWHGGRIHVRVVEVNERVGWSGWWVSAGIRRLTTPHRSRPDGTAAAAESGSRVFVGGSCSGWNGSHAHVDHASATNEYKSLSMQIIFVYLRATMMMNGGWEGAESLAVSPPSRMAAPRTCPGTVAQRGRHTQEVREREIRWAMVARPLLACLQCLRCLVFGVWGESDDAPCGLLCGPVWC